MSGQVEHDPALGRAVTGAAVPAAADRELEAGLAGERDTRRDVVRVGDLDDDRRVAVDRAVHDRAGRVVVVVTGPDDPAARGGADLRDGLARIDGGIRGAHG